MHFGIHTWKCAQQTNGTQARERAEQTNKHWELRQGNIHSKLRTTASIGNSGKGKCTENNAHSKHFELRRLVHGPSIIHFQGGKGATLVFAYMYMHTDSITTSSMTLTNVMM